MRFFSTDAGSLAHIESSDDADPIGAYAKMFVSGSD